jgi:hypothetical protein
VSNQYVCRVYTDEGRQQTWPTNFVTCPRPGDYVASEAGYRMKVARIIHSTRRLTSREANLGELGNRIPCIEVELINDA